MSSWYVESELAEMDAYTADAMLGLSELLLDAIKIVKNRSKKELARVIARLEPATTVLYNNYPCKLYFTMLREELEAILRGKGNWDKAEAIISFLIARWPNKCP